MAEILVKEGKRLLVDDQAGLQQALADGYTPEGGTILFQDPATTRYHEAKPEEAAELFQSGYRLAPEHARAAQGAERELQEQFGSPAETVRTIGEGGLGILSFGGTDALFEDAGKRAQANPGARTGGEFLGFAASLGAGLPGAAGSALKVTPAGLSTLAARKAGQKLGQQTVGRRVAGMAVEGAVDNALFAAGQEFSNAALNDEPLTVTGVLSSMGKGALVGAPIAGAIGVAGEAIRRTNKINHYREASDNLRARHVDGVKRLEQALGSFEKLPTPPVGAASVGVDAATANVRRGAAAAADTLPTPQAPVKGNLADAAKDVRAALGKVKPDLINIPLLSRKSSTKVLEVAEDYAHFGQAVERLDSIAGTDFATDFIHPAMSPRKASKLGLLSHNALAKILKIPVEELAPRIEGLTPSAKVLLDGVAITKAFDQGFAGRAFNAAKKVAAIGAAMGTGGIAGGALGAVGAFGGPRGALGLLGKFANLRALNRGQRIFERILQASEKFGDRIDEATDRVFKVADKPLQRAVSLTGKAAPLSALTTFSESGKKEGETKAQTQMRQVSEVVQNLEQAQQKLDDRYAPVRGLHSPLGFALSDKTLQIYQYLHGRIPESYRNSAFSSSSVRPLPNAIEERKWALQTAAALDPLGELERGIEQRKLSNETIRVVQDLHPEVLERVQQRLVLKLFTDKEPIPYESRQLVDQLLGGSVDKTLQVTGTLQQIYSEVQAAPPRPASRSSKPPEDPTKAQRLENR